MIFIRNLSILLLLVFVTSALASKNIEDVMEGILSTYDKNVRPDNNYEGRPTEVRIEAAILDVYHFDEIDHQVTIRMILRHKWTDKRLAFDVSQVKGVKTFTLDHEQAERVWTPDTFIANERSVLKHDFTRPNEYVRVGHDGNVTKSQRLTVTIGCTLNLRWYPFDQNICSMDFESYIYTMSELRYLWNRDANGKPEIWISKESGQGVRHEVTAFSGKDIGIKGKNARYSRAALELSFKRLSFRYLLEVYFPSTAIPIVAFITLCVGTLEFRVLMSTICMFMMVTYAIIFRISMVTVDYKTALDFYVFNSSVTVFNVVLVNFFIYYLLKPKPAPTQMRMRQLNGSRDEGKGILADEESATDDTAVVGNSTSATFPNKRTELLYKFIEKSYLTMPIFFVVFNVIYWPVVLIASSGTPEDFYIVETRDL